jgi:porphobilinogen deaminase
MFIVFFKIYLIPSLSQDLPTTLPPGMVIGAVMEREDPRYRYIRNRQ